MTSVGSTREAIYVLNSEAASIDIVLAEADLPMANCIQILKYLTQDQELQRIPVISMFVLMVLLPFPMASYFLLFRVKVRKLSSLNFVCVCLVLVAQDNISMITKCLIHGAVDYLMMPLGSNELLSLWTHVWRKRRLVSIDGPGFSFHFF